MSISLFFKSNCPGECFPRVSIQKLIELWSMKDKIHIWQQNLTALIKWYWFSRPKRYEIEGVMVSRSLIPESAEARQWMTGWESVQRDLKKPLYGTLGKNPKLQWRPQDLNLMRIKIIWETHLWPCFWEIILIRLNEEKWSAHFGWHHSLGYDPWLYK